MKIAIPSTTPNLNGMVEHKLGSAAYLVIIETEDMSIEVLDGPPPSLGQGAGMARWGRLGGVGPLQPIEIKPHHV